MSLPSELEQLVEEHARAVSELPSEEREEALATIYGAHEHAAISSGFSRIAAVHLAEQLDEQIRVALRLHARAMH